MKYGNELKVGIALVVTVIVFIIGFRFLQDIPIIKGAYTLETTFSNAGGLVAGNAVRINGINIGSVKSVKLRSGSNKAHVRFSVDRGIAIPHGSTTAIGGVAALGVVRVDISLGPVDNPAFKENEVVPSKEEGSVDDLLDRAPALVNRVDSVLAGANTALLEASTLMADPQSDLRRTLVSIQGTAGALDRLLRSEQQRLAGVLEGVEDLTSNLNGFTGENGDSLRATARRIDQVLERLDRNLAALETTSAGLNAVVGKIDRGEGTLGLLVNDPSLYYQLDSTLANLNHLLLDFEKNPRRYLKDLKLVDVF